MLNRTTRRDFDQAFGSLVGCLMTPELDRTTMYAALEALHEIGRPDQQQCPNLTMLLESQRCADILTERLAELEAGRPGDHLPPTLADAADFCLLLSNLLRPLWADLPEAPIYHCATGGLAMLAALAGRWRFGSTVMLSEHGIYLRERYLWSPRAGYSSVVNLLLLRFFAGLSAIAYAEAEVLAPSNSYNERWELAHGADERRISLIPNGIDPGGFPVLPEPLATTDPTVMWIGRIDPIKDLAVLIRSIDVVRHDVPDVRLVIFGRAAADALDYERELRSLIDELALSENVRFAGGVARVVDAFRDAHVVALSSISEGLPYSVLEAMMVGRAVVATNVGGVSDALGTIGLLVPPRDPKALATAIVELLTNEPRRWAVAAGLAARARERFTLDDMLRAYATLYAALAPSSSADPEPADPEPTGGQFAESSLLQGVGS